MYRSVNRSLVRGPANLRFEKGLDGMTWDAVIDVSNVCFSRRLPPHPGLRRAVWGRVETITGAWRSEHGGEVSVFLIADSSLKHYIESRVRSEWRQLRSALAIQEAPVADDLILEL